jgi:hypothetical protein
MRLPSRSFDCSVAAVATVAHGSLSDLRPHPAVRESRLGIRALGRSADRLRHYCHDFGNPGIGITSSSAVPRPDRSRRNILAHVNSAPSGGHPRSSLQVRGLERAGGPRSRGVGEGPADIRQPTAVPPRRDGPGARRAPHSNPVSTRDDEGQRHRTADRRWSACTLRTEKLNHWATSAVSSGKSTYCQLHAVGHEGGRRPPDHR